MRNRWFESTSLQRGVRCELDPTSCEPRVRTADSAKAEIIVSERGTESSNPSPSSGESAANLRAARLRG